jgi:hypothetical protein
LPLTWSQESTSECPNSIMPLWPSDLKVKYDWKKVHFYFFWHNLNVLYSLRMSEGYQSKY